MNNRSNKYVHPIVHPRLHTGMQQVGGGTIVGSSVKLIFYSKYYGVFFM